MSWRDTVRLQLIVTVPAWLWGVVAPRRRFVPLLARWRAGQRGMRFLEELRERYGSTRLWTWFPFRRTLVVLDADGIDAVLANEQNFADPTLKRHALSRFVPDALVISAGEPWRARRHFNEQVLDTGRPHADRAAFARIVADEVGRLAGARNGELRWADFESFGERVAQQIVLGEGRLEPALKAQLACLAARANLPLRHRKAFAGFYARIDHHLERSAAGAGAAQAPPGLARRAAAQHAQDGTTTPRPAPDSAAAPIRVPAQLAFWLFVLDDALELHVGRTLALVAAHPAAQARARAEIAAAGALTPEAIDGLRFVEACIVEQLRLWTPVPLLLRRAVGTFSLGGTAIEPCDQILCHAGFVHRDMRRLGERADRFVPESAAARDELFVFSRHRQACAGETLVRFALKATLGALLARYRVELLSPAIDPERIAASIDHYGIALRLHEEPAAPAAGGQAASAPRAAR